MSVTRQDIVNNIVTRLQLITIAHGYHTDAGNNVQAWRSIPFERKEGATPAAVLGISVKDVEETIDDQEFKTTYNLLHWRLVVEILALTASSSTTDTVMRQVIADIYKAIGTDDTFSGKCITTVPISDQVLVDEDQLWKIAGVQITVHVIYQTARWAES
jgi:hypothetical protein